MERATARAAQLANNGTDSCSETGQRTVSECLVKADITIELRCQMVYRSKVARLKHLTAEIVYLGQDGFIQQRQSGDINKKDLT
ncbi:hypothetical protein NDU88_003247 [Pleurodeles waltl]|uniref:Uncharacterized protein n=1 Tax=Pleurodeles waltl TaxID=8319 RepID=A0AAV7W5M7_PLEWA|nr:hypothetical protein NDU88_003247 [Pleurodeles waltl]